MAGKINHRFISAKSDSIDATLVRPSNWNDSLIVTEGLNGDILVRDSSQTDGWQWIEFTGMVVWRPVNAVPSGWLLCDGSAVSRTTYARLFAVMGTVWGAGDGSTTFNLPDLRDRFPTGASATKPFGTSGGSETINLQHTHGMNNHTHTMLNHTHVVSRDGWGTGFSSSNQSGRLLVGNGGATEFVGPVVEAANSPATGAPSNPSTGGPSTNTSEASLSTAQTILPQYRAGIFVIKT